MKEAGDFYPPDAPVPVWDFFIERHDGTMVRFHPQHTKPRLEISAIMRPDPIALPRKGRGESDGRGTYRKYLMHNYGPNVNASGAPAMQAPAVAGQPQQPQQVDDPPGLQAHRQGHSGGGDGKWSDGDDDGKWSDKEWKDWHEWQWWNGAATWNGWHSWS